MESIFAVALVIGLLLWIALAFYTGTVPYLVWQWFRQPQNASNAVRWGGWLVAVGLAASSWIAWMGNPNSELGGWRREFTVIALTVIVIEETSRMRADQEFKRSIIQQMGSQSNEFALDAVRIAETQGWLKDGSLEKARLIAANLEAAHLREANFRQAQLTATDLRNAHLENAVFEHAIIEHAKFDQACLVGAKLCSVRARRATFADADLYRTDYTDAMLCAAQFQNADMDQAILRSADLTHAQLQYAKLTSANLSSADLRFANLRGADLRGAILADAKFADPEPLPDPKDSVVLEILYEDSDVPEDVYLSKPGGAIYDGSTKWPHNFTPPPGAINVDELLLKGQ